MNLIGALLLTGFFRHYGWGPAFVAPELAGIASKGLGAAAILSLLVIVWLRSDRSRLLAGVMLWWAWEETQVVTCSALYAWHPWPVQAGQPICSALAGLEIGSIGILAIALLAANATAKIYRKHSVKGSAK